ncbi:MAG: TVP38/TMEM64 family protein [Phycisphaeraceae bacterium]|nr:TVP38/TMEM64 family protein [Phycisphaeraceae bacterium]
MDRPEGPTNIEPTDAKRPPPPDGEMRVSDDASSADPSTPAKPQSFAEIFQRLGPAGPLAIIAAVMPALGGFVLLLNLNPVGTWLQGHQFAGLALYTAAFAVLAGLALLPTYAQAVLGGWAFGFAAGFPAALLGFFGGSLLGYEIGRSASRDRAMKILDEHPTWRAVRDALVGGEHGAGFFRTLGIVTLVRIPPNSPFAFTNLVMSCVKVPRVPYALGTLIGMAPRTGVAVFMATLIEGVINKDAVSQARPAWLLPVGIAVSVAVLVVLAVIGKRAIARVTRQGSTAA